MILIYCRIDPSIVHLVSCCSVARTRQEKTVIISKQKSRNDTNLKDHNIKDLFDGIVIVFTPVEKPQTSLIVAAAVVNCCVVAEHLLWHFLSLSNVPVLMCILYWDLVEIMAWCVNSIQVQWV